MLVLDGLVDLHQTIKLLHLQHYWLGYRLKNDRMISVCFQYKPFSITVIQVNAPTTNAKDAEVEWFYDELQDLLKLIH